MLDSSPLLTDLYQFTMAFGYWQHNRHKDSAVFELYFRQAPFQGEFAVAAGLSTVIDYLTKWKFSDDDIEYLSILGNHKERLFPKAFLKDLKNLRFTGNLDATAEGTVVFAQEPLLRLEAPLWIGQLLETPLLNIMNFETLIATKAHYMVKAAGLDPVLEFGLRRAQGPNGGLLASRAAYIGGCAATSNVLAGKLYDIPVRGTHAHSWVTVFNSELDAFRAYANLYPDHTILLIDTYDTHQGIKNAIQVGLELKAQNRSLLGIRLDSGDMLALSKMARQLLNEAGLQDTMIVASNSLNENEISRLKKNGACINAWGIGTQLVTAYNQPALDGVYKLTALRPPNSDWLFKLKRSEQTVKQTLPGRHQIRRYSQDGKMKADLIYELSLGVSLSLLDNNLDLTSLNTVSKELLNPILRNGETLDESPSIHEIRACAKQETDAFYQRFNSGLYPVMLEKNLQDLQAELLKELNNEK